MKKLFYIIGIYAVCAFVHEVFEYFMEPLDIILKEKFRNRKSKPKEERKAPGTLSSRSKSMVMDKIGF